MLRKNKSLLFPPDSVRVIRIGYMTVYRNLLVESYQKNNLSQKNSEEQADLYLATDVGKNELDSYIDEEFNRLQLNQLIDAFKKTNPVWRQMLINLISSGAAAFVGPIFVALMVAWLKLR